MAQPVVHFEVIGKEFATPSPVAQEVSDPGGYGLLDLVTSDDGTGIRGGIGGGPGYSRRTGCACGARWWGAVPARHRSSI